MRSRSSHRRGNALAGFVAVLLSLAAGVAALPRPAAACSASACSPGSFFLSPGDRVPANAPALRWAPPREAHREGQLETALRVVRTDDGSEVVFELEPVANGLQLVHFPDGLVPGSRYRLSVETNLDCPPEAIEIEATAPAELPEQLGAVVLGAPEQDQVELAVYTGSCYAPVPAVRASVDLELAAEAEPWAALLDFTTRVDGGEWAPNWTISREWLPYEFSGAEDLVFARCPGEIPTGGPPVEIDEQGLSQGRHRVAIEARLPGVDRVLKAQPAEVELTYGAAPAAEPDDVDPWMNERDEPAPANAPGVDPERDGDRSYVEAKPEHRRACSLFAVGERPTSPLLPLSGALAAAGLALIRRRRRS
jgi:hypothetical protein